MITTSPSTTHLFGKCHRFPHVKTKPLTKNQEMAYRAAVLPGLLQDSTDEPFKLNHAQPGFCFELVEKIKGNVFSLNKPPWKVLERSLTNEKLTHSIGVRRTPSPPNAVHVEDTEEPDESRGEALRSMVGLTTRGRNERFLFVFSLFCFLQSQSQVNTLINLKTYQRKKEIRPAL